MKNSSTANVETTNILDQNLMARISDGEASKRELDSYIKRLEEFLNNGKNVTHPEHFDAREHLNNCYNFLLIAEDGKNNHNNNSKNSNFEFRTRSQIPLDDVRKQVKDLISDNPPDSEKSIILAHLSRVSYLSHYELEQFYYSLKEEIERKEFATEVKSELDKIISLENSRLKIEKFVPQKLADLIYEFADDLKVRPEACLTSLIVGISACHKVGTEIVLRRASNFIQTPNLFGAIVAPSGMRKSPLYKTFASKPLMQIQNALLRKYSELCEKVKQDLEIWDELPNTEARRARFPEGKPQMPDRKPAIVAKDFTTEGIYRQYAVYPQQPLICVRDELAGLFAAQNKYNGGKGSDRQDLLSMYDCDAVSELRASGLVSNSERVLMSILGTIQPEVLKNLWSSGNDHDGQGARFLYCWQPLTASELPEDDGQRVCYLNEYLLDLYIQTNNIPVQEYVLDSPGYQIFRTYNNYLGRKMLKTVNPAMQRLYAKGAGICGRLMLNLHVIDEVLDSDRLYPHLTISHEAINKAIELTEFYLGQALFLNSTLCQDDSLTPTLKKIIDLAKRNSSITARDAQMYINSLKKVDSNKIRTWFLELENLGYGHTSGRGNRIKYHS